MAFKPTTIVHKMNGERLIITNGMRAFLHEHPLATAVIALAVGFVVGHFLT